MFKENDECCAIQCEKCGGTMYSDAASTSFICSFCGSKEPWPNSENILDSEIKYRHKPVEVVNGLVKLGHVYFMEPLPEMLKIKRVHARAGSSPAFGTSNFSGLSKDRPLFCISENAAAIAAQQT